MVLDPILSLFPVPDYLSMPAVGLDISDRSLKFAEVSHVSGASLKLSRFGEIDIPVDFIKSGAIVEEKGLVELFIKFREENNLSYVTVSLPEEKAFVVKIILPKVARRDLRETIELHLEEHVPFPASSVVFDYDVVSEDETNIGVVVSALERSTVDSYLNVLKLSGFIPVAFEIEAQALARALIPQYAKGTFFIVDFGRVRTGFAIAEKNTIQFSSTVSIGGDAIVAAVTARFGVKEEIAREMKEKRGLRRNVDEELFFAITPTVSVLRDEIVKHENFWNTRSRSPIEKIILTGGDANIPGLADYLASGSGTPFLLANPWVNILSFENKIPEVPFNQSLRYATAIGLALRKVNRFI